MYTVNEICMVSNGSSRSVSYTTTYGYLKLILEKMTKSAASHSAKPRVVKSRSDKAVSKTDYVYLNDKAASGKPTKLHPEADVDHIVGEIVRKGLKPVAPKVSIALRVDADALEWFKGHGTGYQTRINSVLKAFRDASI